MEEKEKTLSKLSSVSAEDQKRLEAMCDAIVNKLLHKPFAELKRSGANGNEKQLIEATQRLFQLAIAGLIDQQAEPSVADNDDAGVRKGVNETSNSD
jgi:glutamyl-tRNA reductase